MGNLGATEILLIILVALLLFGAGRVADIGRGLGEGIRNFKKGLKEDEAPTPPPEASPAVAPSDAPKALPEDAKAPFSDYKHAEAGAEKAPAESKD
jgi:sec-independent protein translocase protein TatA